MKHLPKGKSLALLNGVDELLQQFEKPVTDNSGARYMVSVYGRSRPSDTWQGWLVFERQSDAKRFATDVETTQPDAEAVVYWATGLTDVYLDGALDRARRRAPRRVSTRSSRRTPRRTAR